MGSPIRADLLSDTLTRPTEAMRQAMAGAEVGDDVFGEDPTVNLLQERVAHLLGHEAALLTPTGSMANQLGLRMHVGPGQEMLCDSLAHVARAELGAAAMISGITSRTWLADGGVLRADDVLPMLAVGTGPYQVDTALVVVENTHNFGGGRIQPLEQIRRVREATRPLGVRMHLDGARLWNAHVATGIPLRDYAAQFDTVSVCLSKGLGAPVGSLLVGTADLIAEARVWRKRLGGGMRQAGVLAAAGLHALDHHVERLAEDHARAQHFARMVSEAAPGTVDPVSVETNIVMLDTSGTQWRAVDLAAAARERGVRGYPAGEDRMRFVWSMEVDDDGTEYAAEVLCALLAPRIHNVTL